MSLSTPYVRVVLDDDAEHTVRIHNVDMVAWDRERGKRSDWPAADEAPILWATFVAWHALVRTDTIPRWTLPEFENRALQVEIVKPDDVADEVDPTLPGAAPG